MLYTFSSNPGYYSNGIIYSYKQHYILVKSAVRLAMNTSHLSKNKAYTWKYKSMKLFLINLPMDA